MTPMDELFIVLVKLRLNLLNLDIAHRMGCSESTKSRIFHKWLNILYVNLKTPIAWPEREAVRANLPEVLKNILGVLSVLLTVLRFLWRDLSHSLQERKLIPTT